VTPHKSICFEKKQWITGASLRILEANGWQYSYIFRSYLNNKIDDRMFVSSTGRLFQTAGSDWEKARLLKMFANGSQHDGCSCFKFAAAVLADEHLVALKSRLVALRRGICISKEQSCIQSEKFLVASVGWRELAWRPVLGNCDLVTD